jgi:hypothetical protein
MDRKEAVEFLNSVRDIPIGYYKTNSVIFGKGNPTAHKVPIRLGHMVSNYFCSNPHEENPVVGFYRYLSNLEDEALEENNRRELRLIRKSMRITTRELARYSE